MHSVPRIVRAVPQGGVTRPEQGIPVLALLRWHDGREVEVPATATAWTREAVEITWDAPAIGLHADWIPAEDVRRSAQSPRAPVERLPRATTDRPRSRW